ncbi:Phytoene desaturase, neurosporene or lycopene producing [Paenibacillus pasadenensis]|uniref:Phytoene desaturase, neurosporene or lycopene producing n=1 Tax=Paenibacillus pasadenensis TaxID=217090 RepID=A0A2N5ND38_9BACL|nr:Phytoene desaturase, neurosporene or lycopene producing [Paenibacillus pasadenensis]
MGEVGKRIKAAVVGAGPGGLAAAMLLAARGHEVTLLEKQAYVGGRTSALRIGAYTFDRGPTFLMMLPVLEELFERAGRDVRDYLELKRVDPLYTLKFGEIEFSPGGSHEETARRVEELFPGNGERYLRFMSRERDKLSRVLPLLKRPFGSARSYFASDVLRALPKLDAADTVHKRLSRYFTDERLRWAFSFQSKYLGMSPWECPGTFTMLSFLEHEYGLYHPIGGLNRISEAMADVAREHGAAIRVGEGARRVLTDGRRAVGVELESGERLDVDAVVIGADFGHAMTTLFEPGTLKSYTPARLEKKKLSLSTFMLYLGIGAELPALPHHKIVFASDYRRNVDDMTKRMTLSDDPSLYIHHPSRLDPTLAPPGKSALYLLMPVPNNRSGLDWREEAPRVRAAMLERLAAECGLPGAAAVEALIEEERMYTPEDWEKQSYVYRGATFNLAHSLDQMMHLRPRNRFEELEGCYLVGGGTHPGSGLPTIIQSAIISAQLLEEEQRERSGRSGGAGRGRWSGWRPGRRGGAAGAAGPPAAGGSETRGARGAAAAPPEVRS